MPGDPDWFFTTDGISIVPRASFSIHTECPENYKDIILLCIENKWLKPVSHLKTYEFIWEKLGD